MPKIAANFAHMKCLIVLAHPEPKSFNAGLARTAQEALQSAGHDVRISDLHDRAFEPDEHARHYLFRKDHARFDALTEQHFSAERNRLPHDVQREIDDLLWAELTVLQFPLWWFGAPAMLKGWMDRVFVYGKLYCSRRRLHTGVCRGKRAMLSVTAGASAEACAHNGQEGDTKLILWPINYSLHYLGFTVHESAIIFGVRGGLTGDDATAQKRYLREQLRNHRALFANPDVIPIIPFNRSEDWDEHRKLRPHAPVYSPFIRHYAEWRQTADTGID
jgi:NAD(P)H dehydrogenase (quinone)